MISMVPTKRNGAKDIMRRVIKERKEAVEEDPDLVMTDMITQSGIFYTARPRFIAAGIDLEKVGKSFRKNQTNDIESICEELGVTREEIGIFAQARTFLYFKGEKYNVGFKNLEILMQMGTDLIIIEKEGMAEAIRPFADKYGIAILNSIGFVVRYAERLTEMSEENGCNIAMVTDFDASGVSMSRKLSDVYRIGVDFDTVKYFGLTNREVEERYNGSEGNHYKGLENMGPDIMNGEDPETFYEKLEYLKNRRIEIDSILTVYNRKHGGKGANKKFFEYIVEKLVEEFPTRNYLRAIEVPEYVDPDVLMDLARELRKIITSLLKDDVKEIMDELEETKGVIEDVYKKEGEIKNIFQEIIAEDVDLGPILEKLQELTEQVKSLNLDLDKK